MAVFASWTCFISTSPPLHLALTLYSLLAVISKLYPSRTFGELQLRWSGFLPASACACASLKSALRALMEEATACLLAKPLKLANPTPNTTPIIVITTNISTKVYPHTNTLVVGVYPLLNLDLFIWAD